MRLINLSILEREVKKKKKKKSLTFSVITAIWHYGAKWHIFSTRSMDEIDFFHCFSLEKTLGCLSQGKASV